MQTKTFKTNFFSFTMFKIITVFFKILKYEEIIAYLGGLNIKKNFTYRGISSSIYLKDTVSHIELTNHKAPSVCDTG